MNGSGDVGTSGRRRASQVTKGLSFILGVALLGSQMGRGNETNFLTERGARPLIQCAGLEAWVQGGREGEGAWEATRRKG